MFATPRFTVRGLMVFIAAVACCLGGSRALGLVLGTFLAALIICYLLASFLSVRARIICASCASFFALLPWLGLGRGSFVLMGPTDRLLPTVALPHVIEVSLAWVYWVAETPVYCISEYSHEFADVILFAGEGIATVRPFIVFVFWLGVAIVFALSVGTSRCADWRRRRLFQG
jgi:hypothetical protein